MPTKIPVTQTFDGDYWLMFKEPDVRKACTIAGCKPDMIEDCIAEMKGGENDCTTCYIHLMNDVKAFPQYKKVPKALQVQERSND